MQQLQKCDCCGLQRLLESIYKASHDSQPPAIWIPDALHKSQSNILKTKYYFPASSLDLICNSPVLHQVSVFYIPHLALREALSKLNADVPADGCHP